MPSPHFTDQTEFARLLAEARAGSPDALGRVLMECREYVLLTADRKLDPVLRRKTSASDLVQETFLEAQRDFAHFQGERTEEWLGWLCQILFHNVANTARRYRGAEKRAVDPERSLTGCASESGLLPEVADDTPAPNGRAGEDLLGGETSPAAPGPASSPPVYCTDSPCSGRRHGRRH